MPGWLTESLGSCVEVREEKKKKSQLRRCLVWSVGQGPSNFQQLPSLPLHTVSLPSRSGLPLRLVGKYLKLG